MNFKKYLLFLVLGISYYGSAQNLPSLLLDKNINATFSIVAYDANAQEWGIAVATNNIYVGSSTIYIEPGVGAFSVIAETEPMYAINGLAQLKKGIAIKAAIERTRNNDNTSHIRQVSGIDAKGNGYAFTGQSLNYWNGNAAHQYGKGYVVMGNQLAKGVLNEMAKTYENSKGTLAERLLASLLAGQKSGGQISGKQSAALVVKGTNNEWFNQIDLRVDNSRKPFQDLQVLLNYHYGRIKVNQTLYALKMNNKKRALGLLQQAEALTNGWSGMYSKIALAHIQMGDEDKAVSIIEKALKENPKWKTVLPAFYCLKEHPKMKALIHEKEFSVEDWNNAIIMLLALNRLDDGIELAKKTVKRYPDSSYTHFLLGKALKKTGQLQNAAISLKKALQLDLKNGEFSRLLESLNE